MDDFAKYVLRPIVGFMNSDKDAFVIDDQVFSYRRLGNCILKTRMAIRSFENITNVGLVVNNDLETYASILALWLEGCAYVPFHEDMAFDRCENIINQVGISYILDSGTISRFDKSFEVIYTKKLADEVIVSLDLLECKDSDIAYVLFTSGSTGTPKGVPISRKNLFSFVRAFDQLGYSITDEDRCLQAFDLTFDLSIMSYLIPLLKGASVYTLPCGKIKYSYIAELLEERKLTVALLVPSTIRYLRPYFDEIDLPYLKYNLFCGESLPLDVLSEWSKCVPNALIENVYGPTECTIFCTHYTYNRHSKNKQYNGVVSIGISMMETKMIIVDEDFNEVRKGEKGELCLTGNQLMQEYWNNPTKNDEVFFVNDKGERYYKTGDICFQDDEGYFMFVGRQDSQVKIQGYRVELGDIEWHARFFLKDLNVVAVLCENSHGNNGIVLFVECSDLNLNISGLMEYLQAKLALYMLPSRVVLLSEMPLNINGKIDRGLLAKSLKNG